MTDSIAPPRAHPWHWIAPIWVAGALLDACQTVLIMHSEGNHHPWPPLFAVEFVSWLPWALLTPFVIHLGRRHPLVGRPVLSSIGVHLGAFAVISALAEAWSATLQVAFDPWGHRQPPTFLNTWMTNLLYQVLTFLIAYALILTATYVMDGRDKLTRQLTETAKLNEELSKAQLAALRRQIEPHFMFNALNSIAGLVRDRRNDAAVNMLVGLSEFLRRAADDSHRAEVSLGEEVEYLQRYIEIQKVRFGDRLQVEIDVPRSLLKAQVPNMLLQPLVENAIKHGVSQRVVGGKITVAGAREGTSLRLAVRNDAPVVFEKPAAGRPGVGLDNLRTRLSILHGLDASLLLQRPEPAVVVVLVIMPFKEG